MLFTPHVLAGAAVGAVAASLGLPAVFGIAVVSHVILDQIPHTDNVLLENPGSDTYSKDDFISVSTEVIVGILILIYFLFISSNPVPLLIGAIGGVAIDLIDNVPFWKGIRKWPVFKQLHQFHDFFDGAVKKRGKIIGIMTQFLIIVVSVVILMKSLS